jgi:hypothetical protein
MVTFYLNLYLHSDKKRGGDILLFIEKYEKSYKLIKYEFTP